MTRNNYKSGTKQMSNEQVLAEIQYHHKYLNNDSISKGGTSHLTKICYYENEAKKRGYTEEQITDYYNKRDLESIICAVKLGKLGGKVKSEKKAKASNKNNDTNTIHSR